MRILIVKLSSLGDVVHAMPAVQDLVRQFPDARIDWVVERGFAPLVRCCRGVDTVIPCELRRWRQAPFRADTWRQWRTFRALLRQQAYDWVLDLQGLTKSALVASMARLAPGGQRVALAHATDGSSWERPTRWVADRVVAVPRHIHAVARSRELCARALGYGLAPLQHGLTADTGRLAGERPVVLVHGTSRDDKLWPEDHWLELGQRLLAQGLPLALAHGNAAERERAERLARRWRDLPGAQVTVWPALSLDELLPRLAHSRGVVGVDSGLSHLAVALDLPHVQIYNHPTAWRTGPEGRAHQCSVTGTPWPGVQDVWQAWLRMSRAASADSATPEPASSVHE